MNENEQKRFGDTVIKTTTSDYKNKNYDSKR